MKLAAILSDFTLGFSDGLTVPFALTAGLSSLGKSDTVIYAGLAELCAGCISMGIGGYLSGRDANRQQLEHETGEQNESASDEEKGVLLDQDNDEISRGSSSEETATKGEDVVLDYLRPLDLPATTVRTILNDLHRSSEEFDKARFKVMRRNGTKEQQRKDCPASPILCGLTISLGYLCGGLVPLLPYCFARNIGQGFRWSIAVCLIALFSYGSLKEFALGGRSGSKCRKMLKVAREGIQMALLGALAAGAAVSCISVVESQLQ